jgi:hypothetical protein
MDRPESGNSDTVWLKSEEQAAAEVKKNVPFYELDTRQLKTFFDFTGGSIFYCLSAVFVVYGIVNVMGPMLSGGEALKNALPCIFTLHAYELALLGVLIFIVSKKVVDDAISVVVLIALFLVGTSMSLGSVADKGITDSAWLGLLGIVFALIKLGAMRRFVRIPFGIMSILGLIVIIACNYLGPIVLAHSIVIQSPESSRRELWWLIWLVILAGAGLVIAGAMREKPRQREETSRTPFLQTSAMAFLFSLIVIAASTTHLYAMSYANGLQRVTGDYVAVITAGTLLVLEILRLYGKRFGYTEIIISLAPLAAMMYAIDERSVISGSEFGLGLLGYPPVIIGLSGLCIAGWTLYRRYFKMPAAVVGILYGLGVVLTFGFSPDYPYALNFRACLATAVTIFLIYGLVKHNQYLCIAAIVLLWFGLLYSNGFTELSKSYQLTKAGGLAGVLGLGFAGLFIVFGSELKKLVRVVSAFCLVGFLFDYMPGDFHWRYAAALAGIVLLAVILRYRAKDVLFISVLWLPLFIKTYIAARQFAYWRAVIVGFLLLGAGAAASLLKLRIRERAESAKSESPPDT